MNATEFPLYLIPLAPLVGAAVNLVLGRRLSRDTVHLVACTAVFAAAVLALHVVFFEYLPLWRASRTAGEAAVPALRDHVYTWIPAGGLRVELAFLLDSLSAVMIVTVTVVGFLIHLYSTGYMAADPRYAAYFGYLNLFTGAMLILVLGDSLPVLFIGWEGVGLCSYLLIGFWFDKEKNANAGRKAFVVNRIGDFGFLLAIFLLYWATRSLDFDGIRASLERLERPIFAGGQGPTIALVAALLLFVGATGKSAQIPLYVWLPDAMAGPTPVSALIHAATMVTAGVYMVARLGWLYVAAPQAMMVVAGVGALTALFAAAIGFAQTDIKKVLAYSTVSQLGFMFVGVGTGAFAAGIFHLFTHAFFKAGLFLGAGSVMHAMGDRTEIFEMGGLRKKLPYTHAAFLVYCLAIAGIFPFAGFFSKDEILLGAFTASLAGWPAWYGKFLWGVLSVAALGTAFYMWRLYFLVFGGECRADEETKKHIHESPGVMTGPLVVLALGAIFLGFLGVPHVFGLPNYFAAWLAPALPRLSEPHVSAGVEWGLMALALGLGIAGILAAAYLYKDGPGERLQRLVASLAPVHKAVANKFYVDELYDLAIVRPFRWIATAAYQVIDRFVIDTFLVGGPAFAVGLLGRLARFVQNGDVQRYLVAMLLGIAGIFWFTSLSANHEIEARKITGTIWEFSTHEDAGPGGAAVEVEWDFDANGTVDARGRRVRWNFAELGPHKVVMVVRGRDADVIRRRERTVTVEGSR